MNIRWLLGANNKGTRNMRGRALAVFLVTGVALASGPSQATKFLGGATGLTNPAFTVTFDELGNLQGQTITNQFAAFGDGVTFSPMIWDNATNGQAGSTGFSGGDIENATGGSPNLTITFATPITAAVFAALDQGDTFTFTALLNGVPVDSFTQLIPLNPGIGFIGFTNDLFNQITVVPAAGSALAIDNLELNPAAVPEPASLALLAAGLAGLGWFGRRRRRNAV